MFRSFVAATLLVLALAVPFEEVGFRAFHFIYGLQSLPATIAKCIAETQKVVSEIAERMGGDGAFGIGLGSGNLKVILAKISTGSSSRSKAFEIPSAASIVWGLNRRFFTCGQKPIV